jgi:hypothetical protein
MKFTCRDNKFIFLTILFDRQGVQSGNTSAMQAARPCMGPSTNLTAYYHTKNGSVSGRRARAALVSAGQPRLP